MLSNRLDRLFCWFMFVSAMLVFSRAGLSQIHTGGVIDESAYSTETGSGRILTLVSYIWMVALPLYAMRVMEALIKTPMLRILVALVAFMMLSAAWSEAPFFTIKESLRLLLLVFAAILIGQTLTFREIILGLSIFCTVLILISITLIFAFPGYGIGVGVHSGAWVGAFGHKNHFGRFCAFAAVVFCFQLTYEKRLFWINAAFLALAVVCLYMSHSTNSILLLGIIACSFILRKLIQASGNSLSKAVVAVWLTIVFFGGLTLAWILDVDFYSAIGKSESMSGRSQIWGFALQGIQDSPLVGYGYNAFWLTHKFIVAWGDSYVAPHAHNGFLELLLDGGLIGLTLTLAFYIGSYSSVYLRRMADGGITFLGLLLLLIFAGSLAESILLKPNYFLLIYVAVFCNLHSHNPNADTLIQSKNAEISSNTNKQYV